MNRGYFSVLLLIQPLRPTKYKRQDMPVDLRCLSDHLRHVTSHIARL